MKVKKRGGGPRISTVVNFADISLCVEKESSP